MENKRDIRLLIQQCEEKLNVAGYSASMIKSHKTRWEKGICPFMKSIGATEYSPSIGDSYLENEGKRLSRSTMKGRKRNIQILNEFLLYGTISSRIHDFCKYPIPNNEFGNYANKFFDHCTLRRQKPSTIVHHKRILSLFSKYLEMLGIEHINDISIQHSVEFCANGAQSNQRVSTLRSFFRFLTDSTDLSLLHLTVGLQKIKFKEIEPLPSTYSDEEVARIKNSVDRQTPTGKRDYAVIILAADLGLRASDIAALTHEQINRSTQTIDVVQKKTGEIDCLPYSDEIIEAVDDYFNNIRPISNLPNVFITANYPLRPLNCESINNIIRRAFKSAGIDVRGRHFGTHSLRHSLATTMLAKGVSLPTISSILGHTSTNTTMTYIRVDAEGLRQYCLDVPVVDMEFFNQKGGIFYDKASV